MPVRTLHECSMCGVTACWNARCVVTPALFPVTCQYPIQECHLHIQLIIGVSTAGNTVLPIVALSHTAGVPDPRDGRSPPANLEAAAPLATGHTALRPSKMCSTTRCRSACKRRHGRRAGDRTVLTENLEDQITL